MHSYPELKFQNEGHSWYLRVLFCKYYQSQGRNPLQYFPVLTEICNSWFFLACNITQNHTFRCENWHLGYQFSESSALTWETVYFLFCKIS